MNSLKHGLWLASRPCEKGLKCGSGEFCPCPLQLDGQVSKWLKDDACKASTLRANDAGSSPALPTTRQLPLKPPFPKACACGNLFTDGAPLYCDDCRTFTHTVYWLRAGHV